jgi:hypothetical protein
MEDKFKPVRVYHECRVITKNEPEKMLEECLSVDECLLIFEHKSYRNPVCVTVILGNDEFEIVADCTDKPILVASTTAWSDKWQQENKADESTGSS